MTTTDGTITRRRFARFALAGGGLWLLGCSASSDSATTPSPTARRSAPATVVPPTVPTPVPPPIVTLVGSVTERSRDPRADRAAVDTVVAGFNEFSLTAYRARAAQTSENVLLAPYSLALALSLTSAGTVGDMRTAFARLLGVDTVEPRDLHAAVNAVDLDLESRGNEDVVIATANRLFVAPQLEMVEAFLDTAVRDYDAAVGQADFGGASDAVVEEVNRWVGDLTDGFITNAVQSFDPDTVIAIVNVIFLKAGWGVDFRDIGPGPFMAGDASISVPRFGHDDALPQHHGDGFVAVELPYYGGTMSMVIVMPDDMATFEASLDMARLTAILGGLVQDGIHLSVPKWTFEQTTDALDLLAPLGLPVSGDFSAMFEGGEQGFFIGQVHHQTRIEVDEEGTRAAGSSGVAIVGSHGPTVDVDRPFFYVIRDRGSGLVLFVGRVVDPRQEA